MKIQDPKSYRRRCVARPQEEVQKSVELFWIGVRELMHTHQIADVALCLQAVVEVKANDLIEEDNEVFVSSAGHIGDQMHFVELAAYLHANARGELERILENAKVQGEKRGRR